MSKAFAPFKMPLHVLMVLAMVAIAHPTHAQDVRVRFSVGLLTFQPRDDSSIRLCISTKGKTAMEVKLDGSWHDLESQEGSKALKKILETKAVYYVEDLVKRNQFTPQQVKKLMLATGLQVARDCRRIHRLNAAYFDKEHANPFEDPDDINNGALMNVLSDCKEILSEIDGVMVRGIDHKDSLFRKVLNNLHERTPN